MMVMAFLLRVLRLKRDVRSATIMETFPVRHSSAEIVRCVNDIVPSFPNCLGNCCSC